VPEAFVTSATGINDLEQIVGFYEDSAGLHGFMNDASLFTPIDVSFPEASETVALAINNHGDVVGFYEDPAGFHGYLYKNGVFTSIDAPGASQTIALGIINIGRSWGSIKTPPAFTGLSRQQKRKHPLLPLFLSAILKFQKTFSRLLLIERFSA
jgi:probable HAF family extracellular repeat protein